MLQLYYVLGIKRLFRMGSNRKAVLLLVPLYLVRLTKKKVIK